MNGLPGGVGRGGVGQGACSMKLVLFDVQVWGSSRRGAGACAGQEQAWSRSRRRAGAGARTQRQNKHGNKQTQDTHGNTSNNHGNTRHTQEQTQPRHVFEQVSMFYMFYIDFVILRME